MNASHLTGKFNSHLRDAILVFGDEAFCAGDKEHEGALKALITEPTVMIEAKGVDAEASPNYTHLMLASNSDWVVPVGVDDRRFFMVDVGDARMGDGRYFGAIADDLEDGGYEHLLHFLLHYGRRFEVARIPDTTAKQDQKVLSLNRHASAALFMLREGALPDLLDHSKQVDTEREYVISNQLASWLAEQGHKDTTTEGIARELVKMKGPGNKERTRMRIGRDLRNGHWLPPLGEARQHWADATGVRIPWREVGGWAHVGIPDDELPI
jgi:hypothetical protein